MSVADAVRRFPNPGRHPGLSAAAIALLLGTVVTGQGTRPSTATPTETNGQRIARIAGQLQDRQDRQTRAGLADEAARTGRALEELARAQTTKCSEYWAGREQPKLGFVLTSGQLQRRMQEISRVVSARAEECKWRPGIPEAGTHLDPAIWKSVIANESQTTRARMFVAPVMMTGTDPDVRDRQMEFLTLAEGLKTEGKGLEDLPETVLSLTTALPGVTETYEQIYEQLKNRLGQSPQATIMILELLGGFAERADDPTRAMGYVQLELSLVEQEFGSTSARLCPTLWRQASLQLALQEPDRAVASVSRCLGLLAGRGEGSITLASALNNLGVVQQQSGSLAGALESYQTSLAMFERIPLQTDPFVRADNPLLRVRSNLGLVHWQRGNVAEAARHLELAREQLSKEGLHLQTERGFVESMANLAPELSMLLTVERAAEQAMIDPPSLALPVLLERKGLALEAKTASVKAFGDDPVQLREYRALLARRSSVARGSAATDEERLAAQTSISEIDLQILLLEVAARQRAANAASVAASADPRKAAYDAAVQAATMKRMEEAAKRAQAARKSGRNNAANDSEPTMVEMEAMMKVQQQALADVAPKFKDYLESQSQADRGEREVLLERVQARVPDTAALVEAVRFQPFNVHGATDATRWAPARYGAYLVRRTGRPRFLDFGDAASIDDLIVEFRRALSQPRGTLARDLGRRLDAALMQPVRAHLGTATELYLSPDGLLNLVPFAALVDERDRYLLETFTFNYLSSGRDLARTPSLADTAWGAPVVIADPAFDAGGATLPSISAEPDAAVSTRAAVGRRFEPLPGTAAEADAIRRSFSDAIVYTGARATETLMKAVSVPRILHIATHGFFLADQDLSAADDPAAKFEDPMLRSGLVFASVNSRQSGLDDGILTALEATSLDLSGTKLVVLSACGTGVGDVKTGEGVFGLRRAFIAAGAETLVMSLWQVDDEATAQLMAEFYRRLARGDGRGDALRQAALTLLSDPARRHPFYWAAFIASGETSRVTP